MTTSEINILLNAGDIWPMNSNKHSTGKAFFIDYNLEKEFYISDNLYSLIENIFNYYYLAEAPVEHSIYKDFLNNKLSLTSPLPEHQKYFFNDMLKKQNENLLLIIGENNGTPIEEIVQLWPVMLYEKGMELIFCIKFEMLKGATIDKFTFGNIGKPRTSNFQFLEEYFLSPAMKNIYAIATIRENIKYLRNCLSGLNIDTISDIDIPKIKKPRARAVALAFKYKAAAGYVKDIFSKRDAIKYFQTPGGKPTSGTGIVQELYKIGYLGGKKNSANQYSVEDIERAIEILKTGSFNLAEQKATDDIYYINSKSYKN